MAILTKAAKAPDNAPKKFSYLAVSPAGGRHKATMLAPNPSAVAAALRSEGWTPLKITQVESGGVNTDIGEIFGSRALKLDARELADFASRLHQMIKAGVPVPRALYSMGEEAEPRFSALCKEVADKVSNGVPLSEALAEHPRAFDEIFCAYIAAGESSGTLPQTTARLTDMLDKRAKLALKIKSVTAYPKLVSAAIGAIIVGIMLFLVPMYTEIYASFGAKLPAPTLALVWISEQILPFTIDIDTKLPFLHFDKFEFHPLSPVLWGGLAYAGIRYFLHRTRDSDDVGIKVDQLKFKLPIFGALIQKQSLYRWTSTLAGGVDSGVPLANSLELAARTSGSRWQMAVVGDLQEAVRNGKPLSEGLGMHRDLFPPSLRAMVLTGESAGELATMLDSVSSSIDAEIDALIGGLSAKIEVALLLIMGVVVGALLAVLYLPILNLATTVGEGISEGEF